MIIQLASSSFRAQILLTVRIDETLLLNIRPSSSSVPKLIGRYTTLTIPTVPEFTTGKRR